MTDKLLVVDNLVKYFPIKSSEGLFRNKTVFVRAVDNISFHIQKGETLGLVGESGCGKSTTGKLIIRLIDPTRGRILFDDVDIANISKSGMKEFRSKIQIIFQDPYSSLDPRFTVGNTIGEVLDIHRTAKGKQRKERIEELLELVGLKAQHMNRYPHEFSGGQRQRIGIARALALNPSLVICDEPVSALDVSIQAQILNLMQDLQEQFDLTYLFISHDLSVIHHICDRVAVMYLGKIIEVATKEKLYNDPLHPYTQGLLKAIPEPNPREPLKSAIRGDVPSPVNPPPGCRFQTRCSEALEICSQQAPEAVQMDPDHTVACHLYHPSKELSA